MTNVILHISDAGVFYDAEYHAGEHDVCTILSTITSMLIAEAERCGIKPSIQEKGHCRIGIPDAKYETVEVFECADEVLKDLAKQHPAYIKLW